ncbi:MAG: alpha/beta hydrolase [bacterium]
MSVTSHETILLWPDGAPLAIGNEAEDRPNLTVYLPPADIATGTAVIVCPGGSYQFLADHENYIPAEYLNKLGIAAFCLQYRLGPRYHHPAMMFDIQRALRTVRARASEWGIQPERIGVWGFSAGGHLASTAATHFDAGDAVASDPIERVSCRPDFTILTYPVITMRDPFTHTGSREALLGEAPTPELIDLMSNDEQVTAGTPPTFLIHTDKDGAVPAENSVQFYLQCRKHGVSAEMHIYEQGPHGFGLAPEHPLLCTWPDRLTDWLRARGFCS